MKLAGRTVCTGCMACVDACGHRVLRVEVDPEGYFVVGVDKENACVECGKCTRVCPVLNKRKAEKGRSQPYAAWNGVSEQRVLSASGGVFAALAAAVLRKGGVVYGAAIEGFDAVHKRITQADELPFLQGSKYQPSILTGIYRSVRDDLLAGRIVLFSGLGCQVAGLLSFLGTVNREKLYTVDMICGGVSTMLPMIRLKESGVYKGIRSFRDKDDGWRSKGFRYALKMIRNDGSVENLGLDNLVLDAFSSKLLKRSSCLDCEFAGFRRASDCTIGDFWGDERFKEQHAHGLSVFIIHHERIMDLVHATHLETEPVAWKEIIADNHNLYWTRYPWIRHFISRKAALRAMQRRNYPKVMHQMNPWSIPGLCLRAYLKMNMLHRKFCFFHTISILDEKK